MDRRIGVGRLQNVFHDVRHYLYHQHQDLYARGLRPSALLKYADQIAGVCSTAFADADANEWLEVVVALRPAYTSRAWVLSPRSRDDLRLTQLRRDVELHIPPIVGQGPIVLALSGAIGDATPRWRMRDETEFPWPGEWLEVPEEQRQSFDDMIEAAWPRRRARRLSGWLREVLADEGLIDTSKVG
jgi:hypothetical protein